jgi:hypothetical protein
MLVERSQERQSRLINTGNDLAELPGTRALDNYSSCTGGVKDRNEATRDGNVGTLSSGHDAGTPATWAICNKWAAQLSERKGTGTITTIYN